MATFEKGDAWDEIPLIQAKLGVTQDGKFGPATEKAVRTWQQANGMKVDGMVGPDMLMKLGLPNLVLLEDGDEGDLVRQVQAALAIEADGEYGKQTVRAVKSFQKDNGLKATGVADIKTLKALGIGSPAPEKPAPAPAPSPTPAASPAPAAPLETKSSWAWPWSKSTAKAPPAQLSSWAYQLAEIDPAIIAALNVDLVVVDYSADGSDDMAFKPADVTAMKRRPDSGTKKVVSYMSIGEAETYRYYWQKSWSNKKTKPAWLDDENPDWEGNFKVRFWDPAWQAVIMGSANAYLDRIIAAGFDGVYLDIIDAFEYWRDEKGERPGADKDMIAFVTAIATYARRKRSDFMVIPQNGEALLEDASYRKVISAIGKEDVFYGADGDGKPNKKTDVAECVDHLRLARDAGIPVLAVEYLDDQKKIADAKAKLAQLGCPAYFGPRDLASVRADDLTS